MITVLSGICIVFGPYNTFVIIIWGWENEVSVRFKEPFMPELSVNI